MTFKIISDSACDLNSDYLKDHPLVQFQIVPFVLTIAGTDYMDDDSISSTEILEKLKKSKENSSSCPSSYAFLNACTADYNFIVTAGSKVSGSYNSACIAQKESPNKVLVVDSKGAAGLLELIIDKLVELIELSKTFEQIEAEITAFNNSFSLYFVLSNYDSFIKKGRIKQILAKLIAMAKIKTLCTAKDGEVAIERKFLSYGQCLNYICKKVQESHTSHKKCVITFAGNDENPKRMKQMLENLHIFDQVKLTPAKGLSSFYALDNSLIVTF